MSSNERSPAPKSRSPAPKSRSASRSSSTSSSESEDSLFDFDSIIKGNQMETLKTLQSNQNVSSYVQIKTEAQEPTCNSNEAEHTDKSKNSSTSGEGGSEDLLQLAAKAEKLLQEILQGSNKPNTSSSSQLTAVKSEPMQPVLSTSQPPPPIQTQMIYSQNLLANPYYPNLMSSSLGPPGAPHHQMPISPFHSHQIPVQSSLVVNEFSVAPPPTGQFAFPPPGPGPGQQDANKASVRMDPAFYVTHPPPSPAANMGAAPGTPMLINGLNQQATFYYQIQQQQPQAALASPNFFHAQPFSPFQQSLPPPHLSQLPHHLQLQPHATQFPFTPYLTANPAAALCLPANTHPPISNQYVNGQRKRKFGENNNYNNNNTFNRFKSSYQQANNMNPNGANGYQMKPFKSFSGAGRFEAGKHRHDNDNDSGIDRCSMNGSTSSSALGSSLVSLGAGLNEEEDLNIMRERELKDLKCKSVVEKMSVFLKYYQQFKEAYIQRVQSIECSDSLKIQFNSLIKYLSDYESCLAELDMMITEHERVQCKNNHRKTKRLFNKTKTFIRYECNKRLQSYIFEYRRLINSQDRYAGMYDLLDMNNYLISLLPDIGISMRRYINRCEKARQEAEEEQLEDEEYGGGWNSENSNDSNVDESSSFPTDASDIKIPSFKEFVASNEADFGNDDSLEKENKKKQRSATNGDGEEDDDDDDDEDDEDESADETESGIGGHEKSTVSSHSYGSDRKQLRGYESFSKGVDTLNKYLLKRVEEEETLDELVKERIIKWINKRQSKYILIFSEVDRLLNQHKAGECYQKFHSYLLFNLGKLVTVCDSYHQKLKELLYSTTIRRKKKRKRVKLLPEAMADVFNEIMDLKRCLESTKHQIKRCNELKPFKNPTSSSNAATNSSNIQDEQLAL